MNTKLSKTASYFNEDDRGFENARPPSNAVLDVLLTTPEVRDSLEDIGDQSRESLRSYFKAAPVNLGTLGDEIYVITGTRLPIGAGDSEWFWIVRSGKKEARVVLFYMGHSLTLQRRTTNGYRDIRAMTGTPNQPEDDLFRYDGNVYRLFRHRLR